MRTPKHIANPVLAVFFPSFFLSAALLPGGEQAPRVHENFGSENYYLAIEYSGNPTGPLAPKDSAQFSGSIVTREGEFAIHGVRRKDKANWVYEIHSATGYFEARRAPQCPAKMALTPADSHHKPETLRSGLCL